MSLRTAVRPTHLYNAFNKDTRVIVSIYRENYRCNKSWMLFRDMPLTISQNFSSGNYNYYYHQQQQRHVDIIKKKHFCLKVRCMSSKKSDDFKKPIVQATGIFKYFMKSYPSKYSMNLPQNKSSIVDSSVGQNKKYDIDSSSTTSASTVWEPPMWVFSLGYFARPTPNENIRGFTVEYVTRFLGSKHQVPSGAFDYATGGGGKFADAPNWVRMLYLSMILFLLCAVSLTHIKELFNGYEAAAINSQRIKSKKKKEPE